MRTALALVWMLAVSMAAASPAQYSGLPKDRVSREIFHEVVTLPYYGVFDHLAFEVNKGIVTLTGQVTRPTLKRDAEAAIKNIPGVEQVINKVEVLPVSQNDDRIRLATYRAIYGHDALQRYAIQALPSIHIIVKNGHLTLVGWVASKMDKTIALAQARSVPGVFSVTDRLEVES